MKKLLILCILLGLSLSSHATERMVLGELFTNLGCGPCYLSNLKLDALAWDHDTMLTVIRYHTWWPWGSDPFYRANTGENRNRTNYYGADYVPHFWIDGLIDGGSDYQNWEDSISSRAGVASPLSISIIGAYDPDNRTGTVQTEIIATDPVTETNLRLHFVLTEDSIYYDAPNGLDWHHQTMRDMIPDEDGESITISEEDTLVEFRDFEVDINWDDTFCNMVVFVQSNTNKEVLQAAMIDLASIVDRLPVISWVERQPFIPASSDSLLVLAEVTDDYGVDSVRIRFTTDGVDTAFVPMPHVSGDTFQGYIPSQVDGAFIEFLVIAYDNGVLPNQVSSELSGYFNGTTPIEVIRVNDLDGSNLYLGYPVRVTGVTTVGTGTFLPQDQGVDIYIQDTPTAGINLFDSQGLDSISMGDSLVAEGLIDQFNGNLRLIPYDEPLDSLFIVVVGQGSLPEPLLITPAELDDTLEGRLIRIDTIFNTLGGDEWPPEGNDADIEIALYSDTTLKTILRIDQDTDIDGSPEPPYLFSIVGICRQDDPTIPYEEGYHLAPRSTSDIFPIGNLFLRADADGNNEVQMADAVYILKYLYVPGAPDPTCLDTGDANDDGEILMADVTYILKHLYVPESPEPPAPYPNCGMDPTPDGLSCDSHQCMSPTRTEPQQIEQRRQ